MMILSPLKNKTLYYEQDYIDVNIKWQLGLGDEIFKKSDVKRAVKWFTKEVTNNSINDTISTTKLKSLIKEAFSDSLAKKNSKEPPKRMTSEEINSFINMLNGK